MRPVTATRLAWGLYDAQRTVEAFSTRLQDEVDLDALSVELVAVVRNNMQPTQVTVCSSTAFPESDGPIADGRTPATIARKSHSCSHRKC